MTAQQVIEDGLKLSLAERKQVANVLIDSIVDLDDCDEDEDDELIVTPELIAELDRLSAEAKAHPERLVTWEEVKAQWKREVSS